MPATIIVGEDFMLSGILHSDFADGIDNTLLTISTVTDPDVRKGSRQLLIHGDRTVDLGALSGENDFKPFSFTIVALEPGPIEITLSVSGLHFSKEVATGSITITSSAVESTTSLSFKNIRLQGDAATRKLNLAVTIENKGSFPAKNVIVALDAQGGVLIGDTVKNIDSIPSKASVEVNWSLEGVQGGTMDLRVYAANAPTVGMAVPINLQGESQGSSTLSFSVGSLPAGIMKGQEFQIPFELINTGSHANDVFVSIDVPDGVRITGNLTKSVGEMPPGSSFSSAFTLKALETGSLSIKLTAFSSNNSPRNLPLTITVSDPGVKIAVKNIATNPFYLYPGDIRDRIVVEMENYGEEDMEGMTARLELPAEMSASWSGSDMFTIPLLQSKKGLPPAASLSQSATFHIDIKGTATPGSHLIGLELTDGVRNVETQFSVIVMPKASFEVSEVLYSRSGIFGSESVKSVSAGEENVVRVTFKNVGASAADSVIAQFQASNDFIGRGKSATATGIVDSVGTIQPGQEFHATYQLSIDDTVTPNSYPATVLLTWKQAGLTGDFTQVVPIQMQVGERPISDRMPYAQIFLGTISATFLALYLQTRKKKEKEGEGQNGAVNGSSSGS